MNHEVNEENKKKRLKLYYGLLITVLCIIEVSFAWFRLYLSQSEDNTLASRTCFSTTLTEETSKIAITDAFPISDSDGLKQTPFTFTLKNNCDSYVKVYITIDSTYRTSTDTTYLDDNYIKVNVSPKGTTNGSSVILSEQTLTDLDNNKKGYIMICVVLNANEEKSYDLRIWMDSETTLDQGLNKKWAGKIVVISSATSDLPAPNGWYDAKDGTIHASLRYTNAIKTQLTIPGKEVSAYTLDDITSSITANVSSTYQSYYVTYGTGWTANGTKFNLTGTAVTSDTYANSYSSLVGKYLTSSGLSITGSSTAGTMKTTTNLSSVYYVVSATQDSFTYKILYSNKNTSEALLASTEDDYGTSYYFRGAVKNNYVQFANKCWRIVRITGDGSVKLVLHNDNTSNVSNPCSSANNSDTAAFAKYSGNTYNTAFNSSYNDNAYVGFMYGTTGSSDYTSTHANTNKSTILTNLEKWYEKNNLSSYESKLADTIWCNDKTNITDISFKPWGWGNVTGLGYAQEITFYSSVQRLIGTSGYAGGTGPSLKCNGELSKNKKKIGLLTVDEVAFAGYAYYTYNMATYLQENASSYLWWTMSPIGYNGSRALIWYIHANNGALLGNTVSNVGAIRPSISLVSSITISGGTGTSEDPYIIK